MHAALIAFDGLSRSSRRCVVLIPDVSGGKRVLFCCAVVVADDSCNFPLAIFVLPQVNEFCFSNHSMVLRPRMQEAMYPNLHCAVPIQWIDLQRSRHKLAFYFSAKIVLDACDNVVPPNCQAVLVVVELYVLYPV